MSESTYIHGTSPEEQRRLSLMNDVLLNPLSLHELALRGDEKIIDFGSGLGQFTQAMANKVVPKGGVVGIERSDEQRATAIQLAKEEGEEGFVDYRAGDVLDLDLGDEWDFFDLAHTRFLLEHVPDPLRVVQTMVRAVKPGGRIVLEDDDHGVMRLWPEPPGFLDLWNAYIRTYDRIGNDPFVGRRLVQLLHQAGARPVRNTWIWFGGCAGMDWFDVLAANMAGVVRTALDTMIEMNLVERDTFDAVMEHYGRWSKRPDAALWFAVAWAEGARV